MLRGAAEEEIEPFFIFAAGADVGGDPLVFEGQVREGFEIGGKGLFGEVEEEAAVPFAFEGAVFEGGVKDAAGLQGCGDAAEDIGEFGGGDVKEGGAGPDAVIGFPVVEFAEELLPDGDRYRRRRWRRARGCRRMR